MQIVIDIPEEMYDWYDNGFPEEDDAEKLWQIVKNGTPLPKGHGRLIDADALEGKKQIQIVPLGNGRYVETTVYYQNDIDVATTIIEADRREEQNDEDCD